MELQFEVAPASRRLSGGHLAHASVGWTTNCATTEAPWSLRAVPAPAVLKNGVALVNQPVIHSDYFGISGPMRIRKEKEIVRKLLGGTCSTKTGWAAK